MTRDATEVDLSALPDFPRLVRQVAREGRRVVLRDNGEAVAILTPARSRRRRPGRALTPAQRAAFLSSAGGWKGLVNVEAFQRETRESRSDRRTPPRL